MILTLAWKEYREHRAIWFTMVLMTCVLALVLAEVIAPRDATMTRMAVPTLTILGMAAVYGVVCGGMMFAGEHETGTMVFLDIFLGQRGVLWFWKFLIGVVLTITEGLAVAVVMHLMKQMPPDWLPSFIGRGSGLGPGMVDGGRAAGPPPATLWYLVVPALTLEAFAWGLLGSAMTRRVLSGAALAALLAAPVFLIAIFTPPPVFLGLRLIAAGVVLVISINVFLTQSRDAPLRPIAATKQRRLGWVQGWDEEDDYEVGGWDPAPGSEWAGGRPARTRRQGDGETSRHGERERGKLRAWEALSQEGSERGRPGNRETRRQGAPPPLRVSLAPSPPVSQSPPVPVSVSDPLPVAPAPPKRGGRRQPQAESAGEVLLWLGFRQAWPVFGALAGAILLIGLLMPASGQVLWPLATLLLGVACGTATFAQEQSDLSYQFLAAQHLPLKRIWNAKILFWLTAAVGGALLLAGVATLFILARTLSAVLPRPGDPAVPVISGFEFGTLKQLLGPVLFFGVWLLYGFCTAQVFVLLCRKAILAVLLATLVSLAAFGLWLPSLLCLGMSGWQPWLAPLGLLVVTRLLIRTWAGGGIKERKPLTVLIGFGVAAVAWAALNGGLRAWEVADVGAPLDRVAFRASVQSDVAQPAGKLIQEALADIDAEKEGPWLPRMAKATRLPVGVIETPSGEGHTSLLRHLPASRKMSARLLSLSRQAVAEGKLEIAFEHLAQILALSRNLRNKAPLPSYLAGVELEDAALANLNGWFARRKPPAKLLERMLQELKRHADQTPPPVDCLQTECLRAGGAVLNPVSWTFYSGPPAPGRVPERWLGGMIALSLDTPWEDERKTRLWQAVWAGLFRALETPHWELSAPSEVQTRKESTRQILDGWLPAAEGPGASLTLGQLGSLLDASWLADVQLFAPVVSLRSAATRARWRVDSCRLTVALGLYQLQEKKTAQKLEDLVPKYLPELPLDPYSGKPYLYRISPGEEIHMHEDQGAAARKVQPGQAILWSTGPDKVDHGGHLHGRHLADDDSAWAREGFDLIAVIPYWP